MMTDVVIEDVTSLEAHVALPMTPRMSRFRRRAASMNDVGDPDRPLAIFQLLEATPHGDAQVLCFEVESKLLEVTGPSRERSKSFSGKPVHTESIRQTRVPRLISTSPFRDNLALKLTRGGINSTQQFVETGDIQDLELAILFWQEGGRINSLFDAMQAHRIISYIAYDKFIATRDREIGTTLIELLRRLLEKDEEDQKMSHQRTLAKLLHEYYLSFGDATAAEESIAINRRLLDVTPSGPDQVEIRNFLGTSLMNRGKVTGSMTDLREAVKLLSGVLEEDGKEEGKDLDDDRMTTMNLLATAKRTLAELTGERGLALEAVELYRRVITRLPPADDSYGSTLALLAMSIQFGLYDSPEPEQTTLDEVVQLHKAALELMPPAHIYRPICLHALAQHYMYLGKMNIPNISSVYPLAVDYMSQALALMQPEDPQRILILHSLAEAQIHLSETTGNYQALMETPAVRIFEELQDTRRAGVFDHIHVEHTRAARLIRKAHLTGDRVPLEDGIRLLRETLVQQPNDIGLLLNLASALHLTHQVSHDQRALEESMLLYRQLDPLILADHPARATFLQNFAATLEAFGRMFGLNARHISAEVVSLLEQALDILPGQRPERVNILTNLGHVALQQFKDFEDPRYLDDSANYHRAALLMRSPTHMDRALNLHDLASIAEYRAQLTGDDAYIRKAVSLYEETLDFEPPGHPSRSSEMYALSCIYANSTYSIFDLHMAVFFLEQALADDATAPLTRVLAGILSLKAIESQYSDEQDQNRPLQRRLFACYQHLVQSLPRAVCFSFDVERRSEVVTLFDATWLGHHAALHAADLAALGLEDPLLAPELLEQCRSIFWLQALNLRTRDFDGVPPHQADELRSLLQVLDSKSHDSSPLSAQHADTMEAENATTARRRQADRASQLIREIRKHSGLERFLMGRTMSEMIRGTKGSVIVLLVGTPAFSQVWILGQSEMIPVRTLRLQITDQTLKELAAAAYKIDPSRLRGSTGDDESDSEHDEPHVRLSMNTRPVKDSRMKRLLSETWLKVVKPIFDAMGLKPQHGRSRPRLHWCPTGVFTSIPLHAAGIYTGHGECSSDYVVSSHIPTLEALYLARRDMPVITKAKARVLIVAEPSAPGMPHLPSVEEEIRTVQEHLPIDVIGMERHSHAQGPTKAQKAAVLSALPHSPILHLACHGQQDLKKPLESGFMLSDGMLTVRELMRLDLKNAFLAFLSACETAKGDPGHPDQNFHLAAAMLFVGFRSVIGTMWSMGDEDGPLVAKHVYSALSSGVELDLDAIPYALDDAVRELRGKGFPPSRWATFVHIGA